MILKLTARDLELQRLDREPQPTHGSARARIQNALVRDDLAEFREIDGLTMCLLSKKGKSLMRSPGMALCSKFQCNMGKTLCPVHKFIHGAEAEELREGLEKLIASGDSDSGMVEVDRLQMLLDKIDARDSSSLRPKKRREKRSK